ncbi:MAG: sensory box histidine kinase/response regulator [Polyangiaceae bacterium]|jgi:PAS domain S-box-containing protein|nr:sensory box histidine kinase/response regulator [Polyangiaceae bacterium]
MSLPSPSLLSAELAELLSGDDARACLARALARLAELGLQRVEPGASSSSLSVSAGKQVLSLAGGTRELCVALTPLLRLALRRAVEQDEHKSTRERLQMLSEASFEGILVHVNGVVIDVNQRLAEMLRCRPEDLLGPDTIVRATAPEDLEATRQRVANGYEGAYTITAQRFDGTRFRAELQSKQGRLGDRPVRIAAVRDVTDRERTLSLLRDSEQHTQDLALGAFDFMCVSQKGILVHVGGRVQELLGFTSDEMLGRHSLEFVASSAKVVSGEAISENRHGAYETVLVSKSGEEIPTEVVGVLSTFNGEPARVAGFRDLRERNRLQMERRKLEQQLQRSQRLDSLGVLAGGIAHDFNNLLVGVIGNASLLMTTLQTPFERQAAQAIMSAGERAAMLTRQMLAYAGRQDLSRRDPVDLNALFKELRTLLDATLSKKAAVRFVIAPSSVVIGDRAPLTQVLMNLLTNASDALEGKPGKIDVRTSLVSELPARWDEALGARVTGRPGDWVLVEVEDDGVGMDEATRLRVFEPFFTTKEHGHGLGLAACLGIVTSHGGALLLESWRGVGSRFSVVLPATTRREDALKTDPPALTNEPCRVLVIDDEELVRSQLRRALELRGYEVDEAVDGLSGVARHAAQPADVLVVDMTMPDIDGVEVVRRIRETGSRVAIVLSSGYQAQAAGERLDARAYQIFLPKPYSLSELVQAIEQARIQALGL